MFGTFLWSEEFSLFLQKNYSDVPNTPEYFIANIQEFRCSALRSIVDVIDESYFFGESDVETDSRITQDDVNWFVKMMVMNGKRKDEDVEKNL